MYDGGMSHVTEWSHITQSCNTEKNIEDSRTDNIIQHNNGMLAFEVHIDFRIG